MHCVHRHEEIKQLFLVSMHANLFSSLSELSQFTLIIRCLLSKRMTPKIKAPLPPWMFRYHCGGTIFTLPIVENVPREKTPPTMDIFYYHTFYSCYYLYTCVNVTH